MFVSHHQMNPRRGLCSKIPYFVNIVLQQWNYNRAFIRNNWQFEEN